MIDRRNRISGSRWLVMDCDGDGDGDNDEAYILLLLADSNLPTGSFVASAGLESYLTHGFGSQDSSTTAVLSFVQDSLGAYARSALPFVSDAHHAVRAFVRCGDVGALCDLVALDALYEAMTLNHVARRASKAQGVALLTLYSKGFSRPSVPGLQRGPHSDTETQQQQHPDTETQPREQQQHPDTETQLGNLLNDFKMLVRREETHGHLPVCWGALTSALGLSLERAQYLHLFLHARGLLSAAVRLNAIGPYLAQQLLMHALRPLIAREAARCKSLRSGVFEQPPPGDFGPANTWPLGEILAARHDLQHSRIFNS